MSQVRATVLRMIPRTAILMTALAELAAGDPLYGAFCLVALLWLMVADMTLGNWLGLYRLAYYDKVLHLSNSLLLGMIGFLAVYVLHQLTHTRFHPWLDGLAIFLVTLGVGTLWEIAEYAVDHALGRATQGSPTMGPLDDTMVDLMLDGLGGLLAAVIGGHVVSLPRPRRPDPQGVTTSLRRDHAAGSRP